jgi:hypothetical protein
VEAAIAKPGNDSQTKLEKLKMILEAVLANGPRPESEVRDIILASDISESTYKHHRKKSGVEAYKEGYQGQSMLRLSDGK